MLAVRGKLPGDTVKLTINTNGEEREVEVVLGDDAASQQKQQMPQDGNSSDQGNAYGYGWGGLEDLFGQR